MARSNGHGVSQDESTLDPTFSGTMEAVSRNVASGLERSGRIWLKQIGALEEEVLRFAKARLEHDNELLKRYQTSDSRFEKLTLPQEWLLALSQDYWQEGLRFGSLMQEMLGNSVAEGAEVARAARHNSRKAMHSQAA